MSIEPTEKTAMPTITICLNSMHSRGINFSFFKILVVFLRTLGKIWKGKYWRISWQIHRNGWIPYLTVKFLTVSLNSSIFLEYMDYYYGSGLNRETLSEQFDTLLDDENMTKFQQDYFLDLLNAQNMLRLSVQSMPSRDFDFLIGFLTRLKILKVTGRIWPWSWMYLSFSLKPLGISINLFDKINSENENYQISKFPSYH